MNEITKKYGNCNLNWPGKYVNCFCCYFGRIAANLPKLTRPVSQQQRSRVSPRLEVPNKEIVSNFVSNQVCCECWKSLRVIPFWSGSSDVFSWQKHYKCQRNGGQRNNCKLQLLFSTPPSDFWGYVGLFSPTRASYLVMSLRSRKIQNWSWGSTLEIDNKLKGILILKK